MKISGFTFIRGGEKLGYPFVQSIQSILPIVDEFIVNIGYSDDNTLEQVKNINDPKIKIIETVWNEKNQSKGFVYAQQKMIAQYACTGDWAFYLEGDEVIHENYLPAIVEAMKKHCHDPQVEALVFSYLHFWGNIATYAWSPGWYRYAPRIIKTSIRSYCPDSLYWLILDKSNKRGRYPRAALVDATIHHYGWVRNSTQVLDKMAATEHLWGNKFVRPQSWTHRHIAHQILQKFTGTHPKVLEGYYPPTTELFEADKTYKLNKRHVRHLRGLWLEKLFGLELGRQHFTLVR